MAKAAIKALTPPVIWAALRALKSPKSYSSWEGALGAGTYDDAAINRFRAARSALCRDRGVMPDLAATPLPVLLCACIGPVSVTDLGGAFGDLGRALTKAYPLLTCRVVETAGVLALAQPGDGVSFVAEIPEKCDIFYSAGTLPYLPDPYGALERGFASASYAVALDRNRPEDYGDGQITVQTSRLHENGSGPIPGGFADQPIRYPHRRITEARIHHIASEAGFRLAYRGPSGHSLVFIRN